MSLLISKIYKFLFDCYLFKWLLFIKVLKYGFILDDPDSNDGVNFGSEKFLTSEFFIVEYIFVIFFFTGKVPYKLVYKGNSFYFLNY